MNVHAGQKPFAYQRTWGAEPTQNGAARFRLWAPGQHRIVAIRRKPRVRSADAKNG